MTEKPKIDLQDPLPESNWFWRRFFTLSITATLLTFIWYFVEDIATIALQNQSESAIEGLVDIVKFLVVLVALGQAYYLIAPSAEQIALIIQSAATIRSGVSFRQKPAPTPTKTSRHASRGGGKTKEEYTPSGDDLAELDEENQPQRE